MSQQPDKKRQRRTLLAASAAVLLCGVLLLGGGVALMAYSHHRIESKLELGLSGARVRGRFGEPSYVYEAESAPEDYYVSGWARRERPITSEVWVFHMGEPICYVWFDEQGKVEDWFVGGS